MKVIIPVAGAGTQLRPHTYTQPKPLIPVAGKPIISFIIDDFIDIGIDNFIFVLGYLGEKIKIYLEQRYPNIKKTYIYQHERKGSGHAIYMAKDVLEDAKDIIIVLGDTILDTNLRKLVDLDGSALGIKKVENPCDFGVAELDSFRNIKRVVEKPKIPVSNRALVGIYKIKEVEVLINCLENMINNRLRTNNEYQLTDVIMLMIASGVVFKSFEVNNWFDCGKKDILIDTNAILLKKQHKTNTVKPPHQFRNSILIPPVSIGKFCKIENSIIGPNVTIGDHVNVDGSIIKNSIIGSYASINDIILVRSLVGSDSAVTGGHQSLNIGDNTEIDLG